MRPIDQELVEQLRMMAKAMEGMVRKDLKYGSMADFLLKEGSLANSEPYTPEEEALLLEILENRGCKPKMKQCFYNAQSLGLAGELGYVEGYVLPQGLILIEHAWNVLPSGKAVDLTLRERGAKDTASAEKLLERAKENLERHAYLGVEIPADMIRKTWLKIQTAVNLLEYPPVQEIIFGKGYPQAWRETRKGPSLAGKTPEEEWIEGEEGKDTYWGDPARSPYEGDIPPWGQQGYEGEFPMAGKVFYVTAYYGDTPRRPWPKNSKRSEWESKPIMNVGELPEGASFGSDYIFYPFAAIPVRREDREQIGRIVGYVADLLEKTGFFGKILLEPAFPESDDVLVSGGRWFPVLMMNPPIPGLVYINAYSTNRLYGGGEEGGWWYDAGLPIASVPVSEEDEEGRERWREELRNTAGWTSPHSKYSVLGHDVFEVGEDCCFAMPYPEEPPVYS